MWVLFQAEVEAAKVALEQAEMSAVVAATECMNMQKVQCLCQHLLVDLQAVLMTVVAQP